MVLNRCNGGIVCYASARRRSCCEHTLAAGGLQGHAKWWSDGGGVEVKTGQARLAR